jgi:hypothetical protein
MINEVNRPAELHDQSSDYQSPIQVFYEMSTEVRLSATYFTGMVIQA